MRKELNLDLLRDNHMGLIHVIDGHKQLRIARSASYGSQHFWGSRDTGYDGVAPRIDKAAQDIRSRVSDSSIPYPKVATSDAIEALRKVRELKQELDELEVVDRIKSILLWRAMKSLGTTILHEADFIIVDPHVERCLICNGRRSNVDSATKLLHPKGVCIFSEGPEFDLRPHLTIPAST